MKYDLGESKVVVAFYPARKGIGYAVFQGQGRAVDWGVRRADRDIYTQHLKPIENELIDAYCPDAIVVRNIEKVDGEYGRIELLIEDLVQAAARNDIPCYRYSREQMRECFAKWGANTKDEIAQAIARLFPEFKGYLPPPRKNTMVEHHRMKIMDAVALVLTFFHFEGDGGEVAAVREEPENYGHVAMREKSPLRIIGSLRCVSRDVQKSSVKAIDFSCAVAMKR